MLVISEGRYLGQGGNTFLVLLAGRVVALQESHLHGLVCLPDVAGCSGACDALVHDPADV